MIRSCLGALALNLLTATGASAQAGPSADFAVSCRFRGVATFDEEEENGAQALAGLPRGFELAVRPECGPWCRLSASSARTGRPWQSRRAALKAWACRPIWQARSPIASSTFWVACDSRA